MDTKVERVDRLKERSSGFKHYNPKRWHPEFDLIIIESVSGLDNESIGRKYGYTKQHISNILSTPQAAIVKDRIRGEINKQYEGGIKAKLESIGFKAIEKVEKFMMDEDGLAEKSPFNFIDRALRIGESVGVIGSKNANNPNSNVGIINNGNLLMVSGDKANDLASALTKSMALEEIIPTSIK